MAKTKLKKSTPSNNPQGRMVAYIPADSFVEGHGFRVSIVIENEPGHRPTGDWPYHGKVGERMPWFWGQTFEEAQKAAEAYNLQLEIDPKTACAIVNSSIAAQLAPERQGLAKKLRRDDDEGDER